MASKKDSVYPPLRLLHRVAEVYPTAWAEMAMFHFENGVGELPSWPEWCYVPMGGALAITKTHHLLGPLDAPSSGEIYDAQLIAALAPWRRSKEVFVMDAEMQ